MMDAIDVQSSEVPGIDRVLYGSYDTALEPTAADGSGDSLCQSYDAASFRLLVERRTDFTVVRAETDWPAAQMPLASARKSEAICEAALNELGAGIVVADSRGVVVLANRAAEALAARCGGLALSVGGEGRAVTAALSEDTRRLRHMIARAAAGEGGSMRLRTAAGAFAYAVTASPLPRGAGALQRKGQALALLLITDLNEAASFPERSLRELFGLTPAEARLVFHLARGKTRAEYAEQAGIAVLTAQTHLRRAFSKLGVNRESDLVRMVLSLVR